MWRQLMKVHVEQYHAKSRAAKEEKNKPANHHHNTKCEASKSNKPYYVQYNMDDGQGSIVNHYKQEHFQHNCKFVEDNQQNSEKLFERDIFQKVLNHIANTLNQEIPKAKQKNQKEYKLGNS